MGVNIYMKRKNKYKADYIKLAKIHEYNLTDYELYVLEVKYKGNIDKFIYYEK